MKPPPNDDLPKEPPESMPLNKERKDSEVQPPNPVPPESQSNEKNSLTKNIIKPKEKEVLEDPEVKKPAVKVSEIHPRNLKTKLETKLANGEAKLANGVSNGEAQKPKEEKPQSNEDKIDMMKQQQLIETIKQHGEEQKELIKEQKEILHEILKTKKELQQNKNEAVEANEAKKIAVESIKQIADMAIKSIGGVTEKPDLVKNDLKVEERLEKLTNDAVQEIAKKAVETIEAIQDIKEKPEQPSAAQPVQNVLPNAQSNVQVNPAQNVQVNPAQNVQVNSAQNAEANPAQVQANAAPVQVNPAQNVQNNQNVLANQNVQTNQNVQPQVPVNPINIPQAVNPPVIRTKDEAPNNAAAAVPQVNNVANQNNGPVVQNVGNNNVANQNNVAVAQNNIAPNVNQQIIHEVKPVVNEIPKVNAQIPNNVQNPQQVVNEPINQESDAVKQHSHSPDEPQSYKQGEDTQAKPETKVVQNVPPPIVNELANNQMKMDKKLAVPKAVDDIQVNAVPQVQNNGANLQQNIPIANANLQNVLSRQKREVVDCTDKVSLKSKDKQICSNLVDGKIKDSEEIFPKSVDMNEMALPKNLPMDMNVLHHISRQLKTFEKDER